MVNILNAIIYVLIGIIIHGITEPHLNIKNIRGYSKRNLITLFLDMFLWLPFLVAMIVINSYKYLIKK